MTNSIPTVIASTPPEMGPEHIFNSARYPLLQAQLIESGFVRAEEILVPAPATPDDLLLVHTSEWVEALERGLTPEQLIEAEIDWDPALSPALRSVVGGTILAGEKALELGAAFHIGGGFHHAFTDHGEGFCLVNDIAVAIRKLQKSGAVRRVMVIDVDAHQGNGTAGIFRDDKEVFTYSIHEEDNYPSVKARSSLDVGLFRAIGDARYLKRLEETCVPALHDFRPELMFYVAGSDPYSGDRLSGLGLSKEGLKQRDRLVFTAARAHGVPTAVVMGGGYAVQIMSTVLIYLNTINELAAAYNHSPIREAV